MSIEYSEAVSQLISQFAKMPGVGHKTAQRLTFYILKITEEDAKALANAILSVKEKVHYCSKCFGITETDPCSICQSDKRDNSTICIVEEASDVVALEKTKEYKGLYHVLHGVLSPLDGIGPDDLRLKELLERIQSNISNIKEIIIATNPNVEGEATAMYIVKLIKPLGIKVTRIARGLPVGGDLEFADKVTLSKALEGRKEM